MKQATKILIVEDEPIIASDIEMTLEELGYQITDVVDDAESAIESIEKRKPDLVLLDINIEGDTDGIMLAQDIKEQFKIPFIYLTSNADKVTINRVKRTNPAGFIVKPFSEKELQSNIEIALFNLKEQQPTSKVSSDFFVKDSGSLIKIKVDELLFVQADDNYTRFYTLKKQYFISSTLKKVSEKLSGDPFIRIHRSYIINVNFIDRIYDGYVFIGKHKLSIGRSYHDAFYEKISKL